MKEKLSESWYLVSDYPFFTIKTPTYPNFSVLFLLRGTCRDINMEDGAYTWRAFGGNVAVVVLGNFLADSEADACTFIFIPSVEPLEQVKYTVLITLIEPDPIVGDTNATERPLPFVVFHDIMPNPDNGLPVRTAVFDAVADEVLQKLMELDRDYR